MSVQFTIQEYFTVNNTNNDCGTTAIMHQQLEQLVARMSDQCVDYCKLSLKADGKEYNFCGTEAAPELSALLTAMSGAASIALSASYEYNESDNAPIHCNLCQHLKNQGKEVPNGVFYCVYSDSDCSDSVGSLAAYGTRNGKTYYGDVPYEAVAELPTDGDWFSPLTTVVYEPDDVKNIDLTKVKAVCEKLCTLSEADTLEVSETEIHFFLNNLQLHTQGDFEKFIHLYAQLMELTHGECAFMGELVDLSGETPRLLKLDIQANGTFRVEIASL